MTEHFGYITQAVHRVLDSDVDTIHNASMLLRGVLYSWVRDLERLCEKAKTKKLLHDKMMVARIVHQFEKGSIMWAALGHPVRFSVFRTHSRCAWEQDQQLADKVIGKLTADGSKVRTSDSHFSKA